jgi:cytochrome c1
LVSQGLDPKEAQARIDGLSDAEVNDIANKLDQLPAGGVLGTILIIAFLVFLILLLTDIAGYTDIFPFVKKK